MKRIIVFLLILSLTFGITACGSDSGDDVVEEINQDIEVEDDSVDEKIEKVDTNFNKNQIIKENLEITFETGVEAIFSISDEDYSKYNEIMDYLNENHSRPEEELYGELAEIYGESAEQLNDFMLNNMQNAINRSMSKNTLRVEDIDNLVDKFVEENIVSNSMSIKSINSELQGIGSISHVDIEVDGEEFAFIIKFRFSDDYKLAEVLQFKVNSTNIDLE